MTKQNKMPDEIWVYGNRLFYEDKPVGWSNTSWKEPDNKPEYHESYIKKSIYDEYKSQSIPVSKVEELIKYHMALNPMCGILDFIEELQALIPDKDGD